MVSVLAAAGGAAAGGAVVAGKHYLNGLADRYSTAKHKKQSAVISDLVRKNLKAEQVPMPAGFDINDLRLTLRELTATVPAYPPMRLAFDAIHVYQSKRKGTACYGTVRTRRLGCTDAFDADPRTVACEFLKFWIREKIADRDIQACELLAYRNFCRGFLNYAEIIDDRNKISFCQTMAHVSGHLDDVLRLRLRELRSGSQLMERLHGEAYHFALYAVKVSLLVGTHIAAPDVQHSLDSLALLRRTALPGSLLNSEFDKKLAAKMESAWQTDCGRLVRLLLITPHMERLITAREGALSPEQATIPLTVVVERAENLPDVQAFDIVSPYVKVKVLRGGEVLSRARTTVQGDRNPNWNERLIVEMPVADVVGGKVADNAETTLVLEVSDYRTSTWGHGNTTYAHAHPMTAALVRGLAEEGRAVRLALEPCHSRVSQQKLENAAVFIRLECPRFDLEVDALRRRWCQDGGCRAVSSGLKFPEVGHVFLTAMQAVEHAIYFLDIVLGQCAELARLLGDLGVVLMAPALASLLDEVEQRVGVAESAVVAVLDKVYAAQVDLVKVGKGGRSVLSCTSAASTCNAEQRQDAQHGVDSLRDLKRKILETSAELRRVCLRYDGIGGLFQEAATDAQQLLARLQDSDTTRRSSRFGGVLSDIVNKHGACGRAGIALLQGVAVKNMIRNEATDSDSDF